MLKIVVFDGGYGGEFLADALEEALPIVEITRVIDWKNSDAILKSPRLARRHAERALKSYFGKVDLIVFANYLLSATSLKYFTHKYRHQNFLGINLPTLDTFIDRGVLILTTAPLTRTRAFRKYLVNLNKTTKVLTPDGWATKIDDGELTPTEIKYVIHRGLENKKFRPQEVVLACTQFSDIKGEIKSVLGHNVKIYDGFDDTVRRVCKFLGIRGGIGRKR